MLAKSSHKQAYTLSQMNSLKITKFVLNILSIFSIKNYNMVLLECLVFSDTFVNYDKEFAFLKNNE